MELVEMDLMQAQIGELTAELTGAQQRLKKLEEGGGGGGGNQYIVELGTTTPRMVYEAIQQGKSIVIQGTTSYEVSETFPADGLVEAYYNNISDVSPVLLYSQQDSETGGNNYYLGLYTETQIAMSYDPDEPFEE